MIASCLLKKASEKMVVETGDLLKESLRPWNQLIRSWAPIQVAVLYMVCPVPYTSPSVSLLGTFNIESLSREVNPITLYAFLFRIYETEHFPQLLLHSRELLANHTGKIVLHGVFVLGNVDI